ncbi:sensor domain-containing protein [Sulfuriferula thiophila]|uniref:sensor domain-containing protein n=1 Tax=Sulfuriferula thiophila TaxID=1781211 RepID=UPI001CB9A9E7|nr:bifunctional diguanylate cyclase/phosphodiesterase [Sulfuriferula thiophila]
MMNPNWLAFIEGMLDAVWLVDPIDLCIIAANQPAADMIGVERNWLIGKPVIDLACTPEDLFFWEDVAMGLSNEIHSETLLNHQDGSSLHVQRRVTLIRSDNAVLYIVAIRDVTEQRNAEKELERLIAELRATLESSADGLLVTDLNHAIRAYNQTFAGLWDMPVALLTERNDAAIYEWINQSIATRTENTLTRSGNARLVQSTETLTLKSGRILECISLPQYARGQAIGKVYTYRDISEHVANEARLQLASKVFEASLNAIFITDTHHQIIAANPSCENLTGYTQAELLGLKLCDLFFLHCDDDKLSEMMAQIDNQGYWEAELWNRHKNGETYLCVASVVRVQDQFHKTTHHLCFLKDLTETHVAKKRIEELAYNDVLTGLPNRLLLTQQIERTINLAKRNQTSFAILFLDLDHFKKINDSLGHQFGDQVLVEVAQRLKGCIREIDMASRLGGDEFVLMIEQTDARGVEISAKRVLDALTQPFFVNEINFTVTCSIGIALYPEDGETYDDLIKNADSAMYHVKERGRSDFRFYQPQMNIGLLARMKLDYAMRQALENKQFRLHYQPQVDLKTGRIIGAEALIRWQDDELGNISPGQFIPIAEETGVIVPIGNWVLREAVKQASLWHSQNRQLVVAINVSALQFQQTGFVESVAAALQEYSLPAAQLELELTESILIRDAEDALQRLQALSVLGVSLSVDDFGTGYSSLNYLKRFPLNKLKIDRSFVQDIPDDESDMAIATAIINLSHALNLKVIAEGVETGTQQAFLLAAGCDELQGFLFAPALCVEEFEQLLAVQTPA